MAISEELAKILAARYGRDVRQAIHDAIEENYEDVSSAKTLAEDATTAANNAASLANTKAGLADEKASLANTKAGLADEATTAANNAASLANTKAGLADEKASLANTKAGLADSAATAANNAASLANTKAGLADSAATAANNAASLANTKAGLADEATTAANNAASLANTKAGLADEKASLANTKAGLADEATTAANNAASLANTKAGLAEDAAQDATDAAAYANAITQKYIHIRYSAINPDSDDDMVSTPSDWIGIYSGTSASAPTAYTAYAWFKYKGETGDLSIYGVGNADGNIPLNNGVVSVNLNADKLDGLDSTDFAAVSHPHVKADITDFPTSMPASDVSAWAKEVTKPTYTASEVGALGTTEKAVDSNKLDGNTIAQLKLLMYPVGSIYESTVSTSPATLFGGTWAAIGGRFLIGSDGTYAAGATGGEEMHALTADEIPFHDHSGITNAAGAVLATASGTAAGFAGVTINNQGGWDTAFGTSGTGGGQAHNNMPPYLAVYMWKRTA